MLEVSTKTSDDIERECGKFGEVRIKLTATAGPRHWCHPGHRAGTHDEVSQMGVYELGGGGRVSVKRLLLGDAF
ncbi:hypothetical protein GCM10007094_30540 [Pseudovibrio japonicus]|uniref:Uncharacterized protein n=1 Tax=Pseudovibrio japonicus TaxID=366534 RepID=A0ABQ3EH34_9HYPH|nr:hypothetical protein GCM10007094_30540 [Pseudovibrio japonicus]